MSGGALAVAKDAQIASANVAPVSHEQVTAKAMNATYLIVLKQASLAMYDGQDSRYAPIPRQANGKMDLKSTQATAYLAYLDELQLGFLSKVEDLLGRAVVSPYPKKPRMKHALNAVLLTLNDAEAAQLAQLPEVQFVEPELMLELTTDISPAYIGADIVWNGSAFFPPLGRSNYGQGTVVGVIDSGINTASPSFSATDINGYTHINPLGEGIYLGLCNAMQPGYNPMTDNVCNSKLIGAYDYLDGSVGPNTEGGRSVGFDGRGVEDDSGHGTHTASIAAGNFRTGMLFDLFRATSGIAPHANIVAFDVCFESARLEVGGCVNNAITSAIDDAVRDGVVDTLNYSISGGRSPWNESVSLAFLGANNAGIFVAASAGNGTPLPGSVNHVEPWVTTVAAVAHSGASATLTLKVTAPTSTPIPEQLTNIEYAKGSPGTGGTPQSFNDIPLIISPNFLMNASVADDGCSSFLPDTFRRSGVRGVAVIRRGICPFATKAEKAVAAGAIAVIIVNNVGTSAVIAPGVSPPVNALVVGVSSAAGALLRQFAMDRTGEMETISLGAPVVVRPQLANAMANFSLVGPSDYSLLKPDITAPGVNVLASYTRMQLATPVSGMVDPMLNNNIALLSGTSMSSPMVAGAALLLQNAFPALRPNEIKSLLMTMAYANPITTPNGLAMANPFSQGSGMVFLSGIGRAGFVLDETGDNFLRADPAYVPEASRIEASALNIASFQNMDCSTACSFTRRIKNTSILPSTWLLTVEGLPMGTATVTPTTLTIPGYPAESTVTLNIDPGLLTPLDAQFGQLVFTPTDINTVTQYMPIAVRSESADIVVLGHDAQPVSSDNQLTATVLTGNTVMRNLTIRNEDIRSLDWSIDSGTQGGLVLNQYDITAPRAATTAVSNHFPTRLSLGVYAAEDFDIHTQGALASIFVNGYLFPNTAANVLTDPSIAVEVVFEIYGNQTNRPAGAPFWSGGSAPVWRYSASVTDPGVHVKDNDIFLDLSEAGITAPELPPGKYWLVAYPALGVRTPPVGWRWEVTPSSVRNSGFPPLSFATAPPYNLWAGMGAGVDGLSAQVQAQVTCGAPWISLSSASGVLSQGNQSSVSVTLNSAGLPPGTHKAYLCVSSNGDDRDEPNTLVPVTLNVVTSLDPIFRNSFE